MFYFVLKTILQIILLINFPGVFKLKLMNHNKIKEWGEFFLLNLFCKKITPVPRLNLFAATLKIEQLLKISLYRFRRKTLFLNITCASSILTSLTRGVIINCEEKKNFIFFYHFSTPNI